MLRRFVRLAFWPGLVVGLRRGPYSSAQISLADDIIIAAQGKENAERRRESELGRSPGTSANPYRRSPGSSDLILGMSHRLLAPLPRLSLRLVNPSEFSAPGQDRGVTEHGLAPSVERAPATERVPVRPTGPATDALEGLAGDEGPPDGLTLDSAIERLVRANHELRTKYLEIPRRGRHLDRRTPREPPPPLVGLVPDGSCSERRPAGVDHAVSVIYPVHYSGERKSGSPSPGMRSGSCEAQYRDTIRQEIDNLYTAYVDALAARKAVRAVESGAAAEPSSRPQAPKPAPRRGRPGRRWPRCEKKKKKKGGRACSSRRRCSTATRAT